MKESQGEGALPPCASALPRDFGPFGKSKEGREKQQDRSRHAQNPDH